MTRNHARTLVGLAVMAVFCGFVVDQPLALWIDTNSQPWMRIVGSWLEEAGKSHWVLGYAALVSVIAWRSYRSVAHRHLALFSSVAISGLASILIKFVVGRPRPPLFLNDGITAPDLFGFNLEWVWNSFPSGHATTGIAIAIAGAYTWPRLRWLMWGIGLSIALGRVLYNVHYASDVLAGIILGAASAWIIVAKVSKIGHS